MLASIGLVVAVDDNDDAAEVVAVSSAFSLLTPSSGFCSAGGCGGCRGRAADAEMALR